MIRRLSVALALVAGGAGASHAQALGQGFELERAGRHADAAVVYLATLRVDPANLPALLGLERVFPSLGRIAELLPLVQRARTLAPESGTLRGLELRVYGDMNELDSLEAAARRWAAAAPRSDAPYREWGLALIDRRAFDEARRVLLVGRRALGGDATLAIELAELEQRVGNWEEAAREWGRAVVRGPDLLPNAASQLGEAPPPQRDRVARALSAPDGAPRTRRLGAELLLAWGRPLEAWTVFESALGATPGPEGTAAVRRFADLAATVPTPQGHRVRGLALDRWADLVPPPLSQRARAEAVRALLDGGDRDRARLVLERLAADSAGPADAQAVAEAALLEVLIADGQLEVAEQRLAHGRRPLSGDDRIELRIALARARVLRGELDQAATVLGDDSSVATLAERAWILLYRGDLRGAVAAFRAAGPYTGDRGAATERTAMLALLVAVDADSLPDLGAALLTLARGDSLGAIAELRRVARGLRRDGGRPEVLLIAGQVAARLGPAHDSTAIALFADVARGGGGGDGAALPAAELEWARLLLRQGRAAEATQRLEHLILTYPESALVPQARRELDRARGAIPRS